MIKQFASKSLKEGTKPSDVDPKELSIGMKVEKEHTDSKSQRQRIALDHLAEDPQYYTHPEHIDFEEEAKKEAQISTWTEMLANARKSRLLRRPTNLQLEAWSTGTGPMGGNWSRSVQSLHSQSPLLAEAKKDAAMRAAYYLLGVKRAFDARGIKFGAGGSAIAGQYGDLRTIRATGATLRTAQGNITSNKGYGQTANAGTGILKMLGWGSANQGKTRTAPSGNKAPQVSQPETPNQVNPGAQPENNMKFVQQPSASTPLQPGLTVQASWLKRALSGGGSTTGGVAPLYNAVDQKPVTLATPEQASPPVRPTEQQGNSLYDMFASRFPNTADASGDTLDNEESSGPGEDPNGYAKQQPEGLSFVMDNQMAPQVGT